MLGGGLLLVALVAQAGMAALRDSVTIDEFVGLPVGLYALQAADFRSESMNPPFFRSFAALPLLPTGLPAPRIPPMNEANDWAVGYRFMADYAAAYHRLFVPPRCMVIVAAALLGALVLRWASEIYGWEAGLAALFLFAFSPTLLAHAHLVTLDLSGALGWTAAAYLAWRLLESPTVPRAIVLGLGLGLAPVLKLSGALVPAVTAILVLVRANGDGGPGVSWRRRLALLVLANGLALAVLDGLYGFEGVGRRLGDVAFASQRLAAVAHAVPGLPLPLPVPFLKAMDALFVGDQPSEPAYYLAGRWSLEGWWYYHLVAFVLKTPLPLIAGGLLAIGAWCAGRSPGVRDGCVVVPILCVFGADSLMNPLNIGVRHTLPVYPLLAIAASPYFAAPIRTLLAAPPTRRTVARAAASIALLGWFLYGNLSVAPRYLEYFNELAGGSANGHRWLIDSNLDWGQDLVRLSDYLRERHLRSVHLAYFGRVDPRVYGIEFTPIVEGKSRGIAVVSASLLMGRPYWMWKSPGVLEWSRHGAFAWLQRHRPVDRIGSMFVFDLP